MKNQIKAYKIVVWVLSGVILLLIGFSIFLYIDGNKKNFTTNLTEELEILVNETGINLASIYYPNSLVGNTEYVQPLKLKIGEEISGIKLRMVASNTENTNSQGDINLVLPNNWEKQGDYFVFMGEIIPNSNMIIETKLTLPNLNKQVSQNAIISVLVIAS